MMFGAGPRLPYTVMILTGLIVHAAWLAAALWLFGRKVG